MRRRLLDTQPVFRQVDDRVAQLLDKTSEPGERASPNAVEWFRFCYALARLWQSWGIPCDACCASGVGKHVAACIEGALSLEQALASLTASSFPSAPIRPARGRRNQRSSDC